MMRLLIANLARFQRVYSLSLESILNKRNHFKKKKKERRHFLHQKKYKLKYKNEKRDEET